MSVHLKTAVFFADDGSLAHVSVEPMKGYGILKWIKILSYDDKTKVLVALTGYDNHVLTTWVVT